MSGPWPRLPTTTAIPSAGSTRALPYPERDPANEARRLVEGSPSHPVEIDNFLFRGRCDWSRPFRARVGGGSTGDGLVMLAQKLVEIGCPAELTYLDCRRPAGRSPRRAWARAACRRFLDRRRRAVPRHGARAGRRR